LRIKAYAGYFKNDTFREIARIDLGKRHSDSHTYVEDWYTHPVGHAVTLRTEHGDKIVEDRLGNNFRALNADVVLGAMEDDNSEEKEPIWTWQMDVLDAPKVTHVILAVW
jgi:hypothetical protein